jgi:glycosyltransferase involved in cell wall biosynthesis
MTVAQRAVAPAEPRMPSTTRRREPRLLMLVSERADRRLREAVREARRPGTEYLRLEEHHGVELLDWSRLPGGGGRRSVRLSLRHAVAAARVLHRYDAVLSDGEHVGVPLAVLMRLLRISTPHVMIGHHITTAAKRPLIRALRSEAQVRRILVHSSRQMELAVRELGMPADRMALVPYCADTSFWSPRPVAEERLIVAAGQEHRDYATLAVACQGLTAQVHIALGSLHSPAAHQRRLSSWPDNVRVGFADHRTLRDLYARARVVAVPLVNTDFQAGVTTLLEAMAMGKAVVVTATAGQCDIVVDGETGITVPPGDAAALRAALERLLDSPAERERLGMAARRAVERDFTLERYAECLARHLLELASPAEGTAGGARG